MHFVIDAIESIDTSSPQINHRSTGNEQYPPAILLALLGYSYCTGQFSSRQIERSSHSDGTVRFLCANTHPNDDTLCTFRRKNGAHLQRPFAQILEMAARYGVFKVGEVTAAINGTKVLANTSKHSTVSYGHAEQKLHELDLEIQELLAKAEQTDSAPFEGKIERRHAAEHAGKNRTDPIPKTQAPTPKPKTASSNARKLRPESTPTHASSSTST